MTTPPSALPFRRLVPSGSPVPAAQGVGDGAGSADPAGVGAAPATAPQGSGIGGAAGQESSGPPAPVRMPLPRLFRSLVDDRPVELCAEDQDAALRGWCVRLLSPTGTVTGDRVAIAFEACRRLGNGPAALSFSDARELDLRIWADYGDSEPVRLVWTWAAAVEFQPDRHEVGVPDGRCVRWTVDWNRRDDDGAAVEPGSYFLTAVVNITIDSQGGTGDPQSVSPRHPFEVR